jgi:hypothetical protein
VKGGLHNMTETERQALVEKTLAECDRDEKGRALVSAEFFDEYFDLLPVGTFTTDRRMCKGRNGQRMKPFVKGEVTEIQRMGGKATMAAAKERRTFRDAILVALDSKNPKTGKTIREEVVEALVEKAMDGCVGAFEALRDTAGEKPTEQVNMDIMTDADRELMNNLMSRLNDGNR